jgi:homoserine kinase type II
MVVSAGSMEWEIRKFYFDDQSEVVTKPISLGTNNTTCYVWAGGDRYVFRMYDNHNNSELIEYELAVIAALDRRGLSFQVPVPVPNNRGEQLTRLENTKCGVLFHFIEGDCPGYEHAYLMGKSVGELSSALSQIDVGIKSPYNGSHRIYSVHPLVTKERLLDFLLKPPAPLTQEQTGPFAEELRRIEIMSEEYASLPHQIVHGDLMFAKCLCPVTTFMVYWILNFVLRI